MTAKEMEDITQVVTDIIRAEEGSNGPIYTFILAVMAAAPMVFRYFKRAFVKAIEKVIETHIQQMKDIATMMNMHIEELQDVKENHDKLKETVRKQEEHIKSFREKLDDIC